MAEKGFTAPMGRRRMPWILMLLKLGNVPAQNDWTNGKKNIIAERTMC